MLRHRPDRLACGLESGGWATLSDAVGTLGVLGHVIDEAALIELVRADPRRYELDGDRVRARHGHSVEVELAHPVVAPPAELFHGTPVRNLASIRAHGLVPGKRRSVHLSSTRASALRVGARRGRAVCIVVRARDAHDDGLRFAKVSDGEVWLVDAIAPKYLVFPSA